MTGLAKEKPVRRGPTLAADEKSCAAGCIACTAPSRVNLNSGMGFHLIIAEITSFNTPSGPGDFPVGSLVAAFLSSSSVKGAGTGSNFGPQPYFPDRHSSRVSRSGGGSPVSTPAAAVDTVL